MDSRYLTLLVMQVLFPFFCWSLVAHPHVKSPMFVFSSRVKRETGEHPDRFFANEEARIN